MANNPVTITWNLDRSVAAAGSSIRDYIIASREDNVQALAILACQDFGNKIAMARRTVDTIQTRVLPTPEPLPVKFLKSYVGFATNDSATVLGGNEAGLRFLGLASALISSMTLHKAADVAHLMLKSLTLDHTHLPTSRNLYDLFSALEQRCTAAGFTNLVLDWQRKLGTAFAGVREDSSFAGAFPEADGLRRLVDVYRESYRVGEESENFVTRITIKTRGCTAWVAAFTEWCLGFPPTVFSHDGRNILGGEPAHVCITHLPIGHQGAARAFTLTRTRRITGIETLLDDGEVSTSWRGMPSINEYGRWLLECIGVDSGDNKRAFEDIIPYALYEVTKYIRFSTYQPYNYQDGIESWLAEGKHLRYLSSNQSLPEDLDNLRLHPFPEKNIIVSMLSRLTGIRDPKLRQLEKGLRVTDLPFVKQHLQSLKDQCLCWKCTRKPESFEGPYNPCECDVFMDNISNVLADILALSLFVYPGNLRIRIPVRSHQDRRSEIRSAIMSILFSGNISVVDFDQLLDWALTLAGHDFRDELKAHDWVASSSLGQAIWPTIFETEIVAKHGFLSLQLNSGVFRYEKETYKLVKAHVALEEVAAVVTEVQDARTVTEPWNQFSELKIDWRVQVNEHVLEVSLGLQGASGKLALITVSPSRALANLATALIVEKCRHSPNAALNELPNFIKHVHPLDPTVPIRRCEDNATGEIAVVPVSGCNGLRLVSFACGNLYVPLVIQGEACLVCCLYVCRKVSHPILIQ